MDKQLIIGVNGYVVSLHILSGKENWRTKLSGGLFSATKGSNVTVIKQADIILAGCNGHLFGLNPSNGEKLWHNKLSGVGYGGVSLSIEGHSVQYIEVEKKSHSSDGSNHTNHNTT